MKTCTACLTPLSYPGLKVDESGVCNHCREFERTFAGWSRTRDKRRRQFESLVQWAQRKRRPYDALVPLSGGKDSTYVLYLATSVYKLRVLGYTFDNGFQTDTARENIRNAVERSGADHVIVRPHPDLLMDLYKHFLRHTFLFCPVCMRGISAGTFAVLRQFDIPLVLKGTSSRTEERLAPDIYQDGSKSFFDAVVRANPFSRSVGILELDRDIWHKVRYALFLLSGQRIPFGIAEVQVPDFLDWDYDTVYQTVCREMGWKKLEDRDEHVDCFADPVAHYLRTLRVPGLAPNALRFSAEIRAGQRNRRMAAETVEEELRLLGPPRELPEFLRRVGASEDELRSWATGCFRHMPYQRRGLIATLFNRIRPS